VREQYDDDDDDDDEYPVLLVPQSALLVAKVVAFSSSVPSFINPLLASSSFLKTLTPYC
jgi:hypothetical protein